MNLEIIKAQVRQNKKNDDLELFYYDDMTLVCFSFVDGHSTATDEYRLNDCSPVKLIDAIMFKRKVTRHYKSTSESNFYIKLTKRLRRM